MVTRKVVGLHIGMLRHEDIFFIGLEFGTGFHLVAWQKNGTQYTFFSTICLNSTIQN